MEGNEAIVCQPKSEPETVGDKGQLEKETEVKITVETGTPAVSQLDLPEELLSLTQVSSLAIRRSLNPFDGKLYEIFNQNGGSPIFTAEEELTCLKEWTWGQNRPFKIIVRDLTRRPFFIIERRAGCRLLVCGALVAGGHITVRLVDSGRKLGSISMSPPLCQIKDGLPIKQIFLVKNEEGREVLKIVGPSWAICCPVCTFGCGDDAQFIVKKMKDTAGHGQGDQSDQVGLMHQNFPHENMTGMELTEDLAPEQKALLLGALFAVKISYYKHWGLCSCKRGGSILMYLVIAILLIFFYFVLHNLQHH